MREKKIRRRKKNIPRRIILANFIQLLMAEAPHPSILKPNKIIYGISFALPARTISLLHLNYFWASCLHLGTQTTGVSCFYQNRKSVHHILDEEKKNPGHSSFSHWLCVKCLTSFRVQWQTPKTTYKYNFW